MGKPKEFLRDTGDRALKSPFMRSLLAATLAVALVAAFDTSALAVETAEFCTPSATTCLSAPIEFDEELALPVQAGFDTGWVPAGSPLQVHLYAALHASSRIALAGDLVTSWPAALTFATPGTPAAGQLGIHYGFEVGAEAKVEVEVLGQTFSWTGDIPYVPQFDFQVEADQIFDPWAFEGVTVSGETQPLTLAQVSIESFLPLDIPGMDGGFSLDTFIELEATYQTHEIAVFRTESGELVEGGAITSETDTTSDLYLGGPAVDVTVIPGGEIRYEGVLHLVPSFYLDTIGPDFSIPIADIPIPFSFVDKDWAFDPALVHVPLPDVALVREEDGENPVEVEVVDLFEVEVGSQKTINIPVQNVGEAKLFADASISGAGFSIDTVFVDLEAGGAASIEVTFAPSQAGEQIATLTLESNDPDEPTRQVTLSATGVNQAGEGGGSNLNADDTLEDGCDCQVPSRSGGRGAAAVALALALALVRRRRLP